MNAPVGQFIASTCNSAGLRETTSASDSTRWYFPDSAVFLKLLGAVLAESTAAGEKRYVFSARAAKAVRDLVEFRNAGPHLSASPVS